MPSQPRMNTTPQQPSVPPTLEQLRRTTLALNQTWRLRPFERQMLMMRWRHVAWMIGWLIRALRRGDNVVALDPLSPQPPSPPAVQLGADSGLYSWLRQPLREQLQLALALVYGLGLRPRSLVHRLCVPWMIEWLTRVVRWRLPPLPPTKSKLEAMREARLIARRSSAPSGVQRPGARSRSRSREDLRPLPGAPKMDEAPIYMTKL